MRSIEDIKEKEVINCSSEEEWDKICQLLHDSGRRWNNDESYIEKNYWNLDITCINPNVGAVGDLDFYIKRNYTIIPASEFIPKQENKMKVRYITYKQAQSIIDIACNVWRTKLSSLWAISIVLKHEIVISENLYKEMRGACTKEQHALFDKIFGKDEEWFPNALYFVKTKSSNNWYLKYATDQEGVFYTNQNKGLSRQKEGEIIEYKLAKDVVLPD